MAKDKKARKKKAHGRATVAEAEGLTLVLPATEAAPPRRRLCRSSMSSTGFTP